MSDRPHRRPSPWPWLLVAAITVSCAGGNGGPLDELPGGRTMDITSTAFDDGAVIPARYTCDGEGVSPPLALEGIPQEAASLALIVEDPDAPGGTFVHWVAFDLDLSAEIPEGTSPGTAGSNSRGETGYAPPCPPSGSHRYVFTIHALDTGLGLPEGAGADEVGAAMDGHVLASGRLVGRYRD